MVCDLGVSVGKINSYLRLRFEFVQGGLISP